MTENKVEISYVNVHGECQFCRFSRYIEDDLFECTHPLVQNNFCFGDERGVWAVGARIAFPGSFGCWRHESNYQITFIDNHLVSADEMYFSATGGVDDSNDNSDDG